MPVSESSIVIIGAAGQGGAYVLRIRLSRETRLRFGRFRGGKVVSLPAGEYAYVGSALAEKGAASLARRLVRHATRSGRRRPHAIREEMVACFRRIGLGSGALRPGTKKKHWNIDYLLDLETAELSGALVVRSPKRLEEVLARALEDDPHTRVIEPRLGAADAAGRTHLLRVEANEEWWMELAERVRTELLDG